MAKLHNNPLYEHEPATANQESFDQTLYSQNFGPTHDFPNLLGL
jgi:hypothetical protein